MGTFLDFIEAIFVKVLDSLQSFFDSSNFNLVIIFLNLYPSPLETVQDFLIKLDINDLKPQMHLLKISIFSLNNDLVRLIKIMKNLVKGLMSNLVKKSWMDSNMCGGWRLNYFVLLILSKISHYTATVFL